MNYREILNRLVEIECSIGALDALSLRKMVMETQQYVLESERASLDAIRLRHSQTGHLPAYRAS